MSNNCIEEIIVDRFNEHYKEKFKNIRNVVSNLNGANKWETKFKVLKKLLKTIPKREFTLLKGSYRGNFLVYYTTSNRFSIREVNFFLNDFYTFVNGKYTLVDFKDNILNGKNIFQGENIYLILKLEKLEEKNMCEQNNTYISLNVNVEENFKYIEELSTNFIRIKDEELIFEDDFIINDEDEAIILDEDLTKEEIEEILKGLK